MQVPNIELFTDARSFLRAFFEMNHPDVSHRKLAALLDWPASLMGDIIQGRRSLPISRAVEFARRFNMTTLQTEKLIMLVLRESDNSHVRQFVDDYFLYEGRAISTTDPQGKAPDEVRALPREWLIDRSFSALLLFLEWTDGQTTEEEIGELLYLFPELKDRDLLQSKLQILRDEGFIEGELPHLKVYSLYRTNPDFRREHFLASMANFPSLVGTYPNQTSWHYCQVLIPRRLYGELIQRQASLINWAMNQSIAYSAKDTDRREGVPLQINYMITHMIDLEKAGLRMRVESYRDQTIEKT